MERFVNTFGRNTDRTSPRAGFRVMSSQVTVSQDKPTVTVEIQPVEDTLVDEPIKVEQSVAAVEPAQESTPKVAEVAQPIKEAIKPHNLFEMFINSLSEPALDNDAVEEAQQVVATEAVTGKATEDHEADNTYIDELVAAKRTIEVLTQAIAEKDEYISKLKEYAQVSDDELKLAKEQNKTLLEVTGKFVMRF